MDRAYRTSMALLKRKQGGELDAIEAALVRDYEKKKKTYDDRPLQERLADQAGREAGD